MLDAIILAGGLGTRLSQRVPDTPKALAPIRGFPFLHYLLSQLSNSRHVSKVILALGHQAEAIQTWISQKHFPWNIECSIETSPQGTGGALLLALTKTEKETLLVLNGDSFCDASIDDFYSFHKNHQSDLSITTMEANDTSRYGSIEFDANHRILQFREKSKFADRGWINTGTYLMEKQLIASCETKKCSLEKDIFPRFLEQKIFAYPHRGIFIDIGTTESYEEAQTILGASINRSLKFAKLVRNEPDAEE
ncbi:MAG: transferase protein [Parachlamydiales bacterium]|nr:transferase protein [Parachlamydiales bacterium]